MKHDKTTTLSFDDFEKGAGSTATYPDRGTGALTYPVLGLNGEAGEVAEKLKKIIRDHGGEIDDAQRDALIKELGDVLWYVAACCHELDVPMQEVAQRNLEKLASRKERGVISGTGDER